MIVVLSVYNGLEETLKSIYNDFDPDIKIEKKEGLFFENNLIENINKISLVKEVSAIIENKVIVQNEEKVMTHLENSVKQEGNLQIMPIIEVLSH